MPGSARTSPNPDDMVSRRDNVVFSDLDDELLIVAPEQGRVYSLNETARVIWSVLEQPMSFRTLCAGVAAQYAVDFETCQDDTRALIVDLSTMGLVRIASPAP